MAALIPMVLRRWRISTSTNPRMSPRVYYPQRVIRTSPARDCRGVHVSRTYVAHCVLSVFAVSVRSQSRWTKGRRTRAVPERSA